MITAIRVDILCVRAKYLLVYSIAHDSDVRSV